MALQKIVILPFLAILLAAGSGAFAQEQAVAEPAAAQSLGVSDPVLLPDSNFYFIKEWSRGIQSFFAFGNLKKAELEQKFASERLLEIQKMVEEGKAASEILEKATAKYEQTMGRIKNRADQINQIASESVDVEKFLEKFANHQVLHEKILERMQNQVSDEVAQKIEQAREMHMERFGEVMQKLEDREDKITEKIENALENSNTTDAAMVDRIRKGMPEEIKNRIDSQMLQIRQRIKNRGESQICVSESDCPTINCIKAPCPKNACVNGTCKIINEEPVACTMDAKQCPDGSFVGRVGPKCEFTPCPGETTPQPECNELWWFDYKIRVCQLKQFCGMYMYKGLQTFNTYQDCSAALQYKESLAPPTVSASCQTNSDCPQSACTTRACDNVCIKYKCENNRCVSDGTTETSDPCPSENR